AQPDRRLPARLLKHGARRVQGQPIGARLLPPTAPAIHAHRHLTGDTERDAERVEARPQVGRGGGHADGDGSRHRQTHSTGGAGKAIHDTRTTVASSTRGLKAGAVRGKEHHDMPAPSRGPSHTGERARRRPGADCTAAGSAAAIASHLPAAIRSPPTPRSAIRAAAAPRFLLLMVKLVRWAAVPLDIALGARAGWGDTRRKEPTREVC